MPLNFQIDPTQLEFKNKAQEVFAWSNEQRAIFRKKINQREFQKEIWETFAQANFLGCLIPKEFGGNGAGLLPLILAFEELCAQGYGNALLMLTNMIIIILARHGSDPLKKQFLPKLAKGEYKCCVAATEEISGNNMFRIQTFAENKGDHYVENGSKIYISGADIADYMLLLTRTKTPEECQKEGLPKTFGLSIFLVEANSAGIEKEVIPTHGESSLKQHILRFNQLKIPAKNLIGQEHGGAFAMFDAINVERIIGSAMALGISRFCLERAVEYAKHRTIFGKNPIGQYQAIQHP